MYGDLEAIPAAWGPERAESAPGYLTRVRHLLARADSGRQLMVPPGTNVRRVCARATVRGAFFTDQGRRSAVGQTSSGTPRNYIRKSGFSR